MNTKTQYFKNAWIAFRQWEPPFILSFLFDIAILVLLIAFLRSFVFLPFNVDGQSMEPTLHHKEFIYVDKLIPAFAGYNHGDVVVVYPPNQNGIPQTALEPGIMCWINTAKNILFFEGKSDPCTVPASFVKRIIGMPGDRVEIKNGNVYVTPKGTDTSIRVKDSFLWDQNKGNTCVPAHKCGNFNLRSEFGKNFGTVPEGQYFILGDNRLNSSDSRVQSWDTPFIKQEDIRGVVRMVYLSPVSVPQQESALATYWEAFKSFPYAFANIRFIGNENILEHQSE